MWRGAQGTAAWTVLLLAIGCGARSTLVIEQEDDADRRSWSDGGATPDSAFLDAGVVDGGPTLRCLRDDDCSSGVCRARRRFAAVDLAPVPLECGEPGPGAPVGGPCETSTDCKRGLCVVAGVCVRPCVADSDCGTRQRCRDVLMRTSEETMQAFRACTALVTGPEGVRVTGPEPGPRLLAGLDRVATDELPSLAPNALTIWLSSLGSAPVLQVIRTQTTPEEVVFELIDSDPTDEAPAWGVSPTTVADAVTLLFPNGPDSPDPSTGFTVDLSSQRRTPTERFIARRDAPGHTFDVEAYLLAGDERTSPTGGLPRGLSSGFAEARRILGAAGVTIGEVRVHEVVGMTRQRLSILEGETGPLRVPDELPDLFRLSAGANRPAVHVFFVRYIEGALGIAPGIPGPHILPGTGASGVAVAVDMLPPDRVGLTLAHEIGHFAGLFHTSELDGSVNDPLPDTPECRIDRDVDRDEFLLPDECVGAGSDHLMFWAAVGDRISDQQAELFRRAYFVR